MPLPPTGVFLEVLAALTNRKPDIFVVKLRPIQLQKVNQVLSEVHVVRSTLLVLPLQVACNHHGEEEGADSAMVRFIQLPRLQEALQYEEHRPQLWVLFEELFDKLDAVNAVLAIEADVDIYGRLFVF